MGYLTGISPTLRELVTPTVDVFAAGVGFTAGSSTSVTLSADPGNENNVIITMDGVVQHHDTYSVSGTTLTFDAAVPTGTTKIEARYAQEHPNYTVVADASITAAKLASGAAGIPPVGQCRLNYTSTTVITLAPHNGNKLTINGTEETVNSQTLANTDLSAATLYYIYAYMVSTTLTLQASTTAYITHSDGTKVKSGATSYALVGMVYMGAGTPGTFVNTSSEMFVRTLFNDNRKHGFAKLTSNFATTSTTYVEVSTTLRVEFLLWSGETAIGKPRMVAMNDTTNFAEYDVVAWDGTTDVTSGNATAHTGTASYNSVGAPISVKTDLSVGYHYMTVFGRCDGNTGTWQGSSSSTGRSCGNYLELGGA